MRKFGFDISTSSSQIHQQQRTVLWVEESKELLYEQAEENTGKLPHRNVQTQKNICTALMCPSNKNAQHFLSEWLAQTHFVLLCSQFALWILWLTRLWFWLSYNTFQKSLWSTEIQRKSPLNATSLVCSESLHVLQCSGLQSISGVLKNRPHLQRTVSETCCK